jgi:hypothetical protein
LFAIPESRVFPPASPTFEHFARVVDRYDLDFEMVVPAHGLVGTPEDLEAALSSEATTVQSQASVGPTPRR